MSYNVLIAAAAGAMLVTAPVLAAATTTHAVHAQSGTAAKTKTMPAKAAPTKAASAAAPAKAPHHHKMARIEHRRKTAENMPIQGHREVRALNTLEAAGYRQFNNLHASGTNFVATAMKAGKSYDVTVTPTGRIEAKRA